VQAGNVQSFGMYEEILDVAVVWHLWTPGRKGHTCGTLAGVDLPCGFRVGSLYQAHELFNDQRTRLTTNF